VVKNFAETFSGSTPDIGAFEQGDSSLFPKRPIPFQADKYLVSIPEANDTATFTISTGALTGTENYTVRQNTEEDWYTVTPSSGTFGSHDSVTFNVYVDRTKASFNRATEYSTLFVRLTDGYSVPITVKAENSVTTLQVGENIELESAKAFPGTVNLHADWRSSSAAVTIPMESTSSYKNVPSVSITGVYAGSATITANSAVNGVNQAEYRVRVLSKLGDLQVNGQTVDGFEPGIYSYHVVLPEGAAVPTITAVAMDAGTAVPSTVTYALPSSIPGTAVVKATSSDGTTSSSYTIHFSQETPD
jgi:hypothetical protein